MVRSRISRVASRWSVATLALLLVAVTGGRAVSDSGPFVFTLLEVALPFVVAVGLFLGGVWLRSACPPAITARVARWILGGAVVGSAFILWLLFLISVKSGAVGDPVGLFLNSAAVIMGAAAILGYYYAQLEQREAALETSRARFRALTRNAPFAVLTVDETGTIRYANDSVERLFGYAPDELVGDSVATLIKGLQGEHRGRFTEYLSEGGSIDWDGVELTGRDADGGEFPIEISFGEYRDTEEPLFTGVIRDITDRKRTEAELARHTSKVTRLHEIATDISAADNREEIYRRTAKGAGDLFPCDVARVSVADDDTLVPVASSRDESLEDHDPTPMTVGYGVMTYRAQEPLRIADLTDVRSASSPDGGAQERTDRSTDVPPLSETTGQTADPTATIPFRALLCIPLGEYGIVQVLATDTDAFDERDEELAELLAAHVTTALDRVTAEAAIRQERDRLEEFASVLSHDLRNPLNAASARLELARETGDDEEFAAIERALDRMERLIDDLLTLAQEGRAVGETETVALEAVARDAWEHVPTGESRFRVESTGQVDADPGRLRQVFENLFRNAVEHNTGRVTVTVGKMDGGIYVEDTGSGIPPADREKVFESGYTTSGEGTGFGLAIVKRIIDAHGWTIDITEGTAGGTRFEIFTS